MLQEAWSIVNETPRFFVFAPILRIAQSAGLVAKSSRSQ
jgi:hypothetical protein